MKLNKKTNIGTKLVNHEDAISNIEGGLSFKLPIKERLINRVLSCFWGEQHFYGNQDNEILDDINECAKTDPAFVLKLAIYARNKMYLRTVPQVLLVECANNKNYKATGLIRPSVNKIVNRADEIMEVLAYQLDKHKKPIPIALKRGLREAFGKFEEYNFAKYNRDGAVKLVDAINLIRPIPLNEQRKQLYKKIVEDKLEIPQTWETILSDWQKKGFKSKKEAWEHIINNVFWQDGKVNNYMAILRNIRNIIEASVDNASKKAVQTALVNAEAIKNSKLYPFRFYSAYKECDKLSNTSDYLAVIDNALEISTINLPKLVGKTMFSSDNSGSMRSNLSEKSHIQLIDISNLMQAIGVHMCDDYITSVFGDSFATVNITKKQSIFDRMKKLADTDVGCSTNGYLVPQYLLDNKIKVDRIIIFTDEQMYNTTGMSFYSSSEQFAPAFKKYKNWNKDVFLYIVNLAGRGDTVMPRDEPNVALINGWSDKILDFILVFEKGKQTMLDEIEKIEIINKPGVLNGKKEKGY